MRIRIEGLSEEPARYAIHDEDGKILDIGEVRYPIPNPPEFTLFSGEDREYQIVVLGSAVVTVNG